jgi:predicted dehydrogenase
VSLRAAVVGTAFGGRIHVPALRAAGFEVVALVGQDVERTRRRAERLEIGRAFTSLTDALAQGIDAVSIAGPPASHAALAIEAARSGVHVLCEKPFTRTAAEAAEVVEAAAASGVVGILGHEFRWSPAQATMGWALAEGAVGTPKLFVSASFIPMLRTFRMSDWWYDPALGGGWLNASGSHRIDAIRDWFGDIVGVSAGLPQLSDPTLGVDDTFNVRCVTAGGVDVSLVQTAVSHGPSASMTTVAGTAGTLWADNEVVRLANDANLQGVVVDPPPFLALPDVEDQAVGSLAAMTRMELPPYIRLAEAFRAAIDGAAAPPGPRPATFADGLSVMVVLDAIRLSAQQEGQWVRIERGQRGE